MIKAHRLLIPPLLDDVLHLLGKYIGQKRSTGGKKGFPESICKGEVLLLNFPRLNNIERNEIKNPNDLDFQVLSSSLIFLISFNSSFFIPNPF